MKTLFSRSVFLFLALAFLGQTHKTSVAVDPIKWGMIKHGQELSIGKDRLICSELGLRDYEKVVEGLGGHGEFVTKDEDIIPAVQRAFPSGKPAGINVVTDSTVYSPGTALFYQSLKME